MGKPEGKRPMGDPGVDGRIILRWIFRKRDMGVMDWKEQAQDRDRWRVFVIATISFQVQ